jgi:hypothetical protein
MSEERPFDTPSGVAAYDALARNGTAVTADDPPAATAGAPLPEPASPWHLAIATFAATVQNGGAFWSVARQLKYLDVRIDTRDGAFTLRDLHGKPTTPADVAKAIEQWSEIEGTRAPETADAKIERLNRELEDCDRTICRQSALLAGVVNAIKGPPPDLVRWSHHDAAQLAAHVVRERDEARAEVDRLRRERDDATTPAEAGPR